MQRRKEYSSFTISADYASLTPAESAMSMASQLSTASEIPMPNSAVPISGKATSTMAINSSSPSPSITPASTAQATPSPSYNQDANSIVSTFPPTSSSNSITPTTTTSPTNTNTPKTFVFNATVSDTNGGWDQMASGTHIGVIASIIVGIFFIVFFSFWFCCGGRAWWSRKHEVQRADAAGLPLYTVRNSRSAEPGVHRVEDRGNDAPPIYAEVAPPEHQSVMRGTNEVRVQEEDAVVSDGKTPLSEIPFEDVVLEREPSESENSSSASRAFHQRHHGMGGDTTGHTNT